ncbi:MAG TPA: hypothetical protein VM716_01045 [Gemmatimonadales bacterium]|nr:hypothetical protein [Gemmatimonadales bacterium]
MSRTSRVVLIALAVVVGAIVVLIWLTPVPPPEQPPPPPRAEAPKRPLQSDAAGNYVPGYEFTVNGYRFTGFSLRPDAMVTFVSNVGTGYPAPCLEATISTTTVHLRCEYPQVGTVTIDGRFLTRFATDRLDAAVLSAVVTVRAGSGDVLYNARDSFLWQPADSTR